MLRLCLFGDPEIYYGGAPVASLHSLKSRALLYYLAMTGRPQPRLALAGLFWGEKRDNQALVSLRQALHQLRIVLPDCIDTNRTYAAINPAQLLEIDALVFAEHAIAGLAGDLTALRAAADAYRGDFLANLYVNDAPDFEVWVLQERESLRGLAFQCLRKLAAHAVAHRMIAAGLGYARRLLALDPLLEDTHRQLMQLLAWDGQISAALDQYDRCRRILDDELSMTPSAETTALYKRIRSVALTQTEQPAPPELHAPLQPAHYHHLPRRTTSFVDRKREIAELLRLLRPLPVSGPAHVRLVTLVGSGGVGKTRLSTEAASLLAAEFSDGIVLVELATLADQRQLPIVIAAALGMPIQARLPLPDQLVAYLRDKHLLLLLDSCEHLIDDTAQIVDMLLRAAPDLKILATSREALLVEGEMRYPVLPLVTPDPLQIVNSEQLMSYASVRLLCDRITAVQPDFAITDSLVLPIAQICQQLDGLPLAIELAAARADSLSIAQIAARVDDLFPRPAHNLGGQDTRHQSLDALIEWSTARLSAAECLLFFRLAVFAGGWTIDACEAICADTAAGGIEQPLVLTLLMSLVDTSLVLLDADTAVPRYRLLETVRRYAAKQLRAAGEEQALHQRHLHFYCAQSEVAASHQITPNHQQWLEWLETECANLQQALIWARHADPATALRMAQALADLRHAQPPLDEHGIPLQQVIDETLAWLTNTSQSHIGTPSSIRQLPVQLTTFIDRPTELAEIQRLMQQSRIITLTGPGGVGKTRLALHAAAQLRDQFADGVCFVDFTALTDPALVPQTVMAALGLRVQPGRSVDDTLCDYLAGRSLLLLLDNCEHLLSACEALVTQLLAVAPALHVLATSRQAIKHPAARRAVIPPLVVPDPRQQQSLAVLMNYSVIQLFLDRATAVQPMFQLTEATAAAIVRICHHLDGLPLAIELAAARISSLPIDLIADRLSARLQLLTNGRRGTPPHHQSLRATLDWSYDLLSEQERTLLRRLAVFVGGGTTSAIAAVAATQTDTTDGAAEITNLLDALVEKSLVSVRWSAAGPRYWMLESIRDYARAALIAAEGEEGVRQCHLHYFARWAEAVEQQSRGGEQAQLLHDLEPDLDNLRAALAWSRIAPATHAANAHEFGLQLAGAIWPYWALQGTLDEGRTQLEALLALRPQRRTVARAKGLYGLAAIVARQDEVGRDLTPLLEESAAIWREIGDDRGLAYTLIFHGAVIERRNPLYARIQIETGLALFRRLGDLPGIGESLHYLGRNAMNRGDSVGARACYEESRDLWRTVGNTWGLADSLNALGIIALAEGNVESAAIHFAESLAMSSQLNLTLNITTALCNLSNAELRLGQLDAALAHVRKSLTTFAGLDNRSGIAHCLAIMARLADAEGDALRAAQLDGAAQALREAFDISFGLAELPPYMFHEDADNTIASARIVGQTMALADLLAYALASH